MTSANQSASKGKLEKQNGGHRYDNGHSEPNVMNERETKLRGRYDSGQPELIKMERADITTNYS